MKNTSLKPMRVAISLLFFIATLILFLDFTNLFTARFIDAVLYFQFIPSLLMFVNVAVLASAGFLIVFLLTLLFGRVYCSSVCPLGTLQDIVSYVGKKYGSKRKRFYKFTSAHNGWRYTFLAATFITGIAGVMTGVALLDPFSSFGRITVSLFRPLLLLGNNALSAILGNFDIYDVYHVDIEGFAFYPVIVPLLILAIVGYMAWKRGRFYCNTVCPVGSLLGLLSRYSLFQIRIAEKTCTACGICSYECKAECIDTKSKKVDMSRCVNCFNCLGSCPAGGLTYTAKKSEAKQATAAVDEPVNYRKREFISATLAYLAGFTAVSYAQDAPTPKKESTIPVRRESVSSPPGSGSIDHFTNYCTGCHLCISACPTDVLQASFLEYGFTGMLQPFMDYKTGYCNYDCTVCGDVCPSGAILPLVVKEKKRVQIGKVKFIEDNCIVFTEETDCGSCDEHCPTKAVYMVPHKKIRAPKLDEEVCIGCGACENVCPTYPYKAIYVEGNPVHQLAEKPREQKPIEDTTTPEEEFPF
jgi:ferredoxin-type protein NapF